MTQELGDGVAPFSVVLTTPVSPAPPSREDQRERRLDFYRAREQRPPELTALTPAKPRLRVNP